jgi:hypothetical protein
MDRDRDRDEYGVGVKGGSREPKVCSVGRNNIFE